MTSLDPNRKAAEDALRQPPTGEEAGGRASLGRALATLLLLPRRHKQVLMAGCDLLLLLLALWLAFALRLGHPAPPELTENWWLLLLPLVSLPLLAAARLYRAVVRYSGLRVLLATTAGVTVSAALLALIIVAGLAPGAPRTAVPIYWLIAVLAIGGCRLLVRAAHEQAGPTRRDSEPVVIYGAGRTGVALAHSLRGNGEEHPVAFVDDDPNLQGRSIEGISVHAPAALPALASQCNLSSVLLAVPGASRERRRKMVSDLAPLALRIRSVPAFHALVSGKAQPRDLKDLEIEDLLGRDPVPPDRELCEGSIRDRVVLVTGAGGSIGSELCRQILDGDPARLILLDHAEYALYTIHAELNRRVQTSGKTTELVCALTSVLDGDRLEQTMQAHGVELVYHAAAYKHVPLVEDNVAAGVQTNALGTLRAARAAERSGVARFVLVSTDKAVRPTSVMGASKRLAEQVLQCLAARGSRTCFAMVRFGNVLDSSGSVVPLFRQQISSGGPVTVTHPDVTRYFMTIPEAASLVIQAGAMARGGEVFLLDMGEPVPILELAQRMIQLSGQPVQTEPGGPGIAITFTGLRPGEKLYEELLIGDCSSPTAHPMILQAQEEIPDPVTFQAALDRLQRACKQGDAEEARAVLASCVSGYGECAPSAPGSQAQGQSEAGPDGNEEVEPKTSPVAASPLRA